jgi:hypothetical protein
MQTREHTENPELGFGLVRWGDFSNAVRASYPEAVETKKYMGRNPLTGEPIHGPNVVEVLGLIPELEKLDVLSTIYFGTQGAYKIVTESAGEGIVQDAMSWIDTWLARLGLSATSKTDSTELEYRGTRVLLWVDSKNDAFQLVLERPSPTSR